MRVNNSDVDSFLYSLKRKKKRHSMEMIVITILSVIVASGMAFQLVRVAQTFSDKTFCGIEEHTHTASCLSEEATSIVAHQMLVCIKEEHVHADGCYETQRVLVCDEQHEHTDECYEEQRVLVCEREEHTH